MEEFIKTTTNKIQKEYGWNIECAKSFAQFLSLSSENSTNRYPENYPFWCNFIIAAHKLSKHERPTETHIICILQEIAGWTPRGESVRYLKVEYQKGIMLLDYYDYLKHNDL